MTCLIINFVYLLKISAYSPRLPYNKLIIIYSPYASRCSFYRVLPWITSLESLPKEFNLMRQRDISRINLIKQYAISVGAQLSWMKAEISLPSKVACYKFSARRNFAVFGRRIIISVNGGAYNFVQCVTRSEMCHGHSSKPSRWKRESNMITVFTAISRTVRNYFVYISQFRFSTIATNTLLENR